MSLVAAKCTQCGTNLKIDNTLEAAVCPHCKTPFITEKAINNYNTYNQSNYNIQHANLQINDEKSIENRLKNAEIFLTTHKDYTKALGLFKEISEDAPDDYRTWWGIVRAGTKEFSDSRVENRYGVLHIPYADFYDKALRVAPEDVKGRLTKTWQEYSKPIIEMIEKAHELADLNKELEDLKNELKYLKDKRFMEIFHLEVKSKRDVSGEVLVGLCYPL